MKKIGIITINDFGNYGNRLQCYAVQHYLESMGYSVENIYNTYRRSGFIVNSIKKVIQLLKYFSVRKNICRGAGCLCSPPFARLWQISGNIVGAGFPGPCGTRSEART